MRLLYIGILELPLCSTHGQLTAYNIPKSSYWFVGREFKKHVTQSLFEEIGFNGINPPPLLNISAMQPKTISIDVLCTKNVFTLLLQPCQ